MSEITLTKKQAEYIRNAHHRWNFAIGAVRSGKSYIGIRYVLPYCLRERRNKKGLNFILGVTRETIERNVLQPIRGLWGEDAASPINSRSIATVFGESVYCIGAGSKDQVTRIRGSEIKFCYVDEIVDTDEEVFEMLKSRLSLSYSTCHATANPSYPEHFVKRFIDNAENGADIYCQNYTLYDNPYLPEDYIRNLEIEYAGTVYYHRYILGEWVKAEGLIFPMYDNAIEEVPDLPTSEMCLSIDYGTQNPFAMLLWEKKGPVWYATRGYYYSGRESGKQKTDSDYGEDVDNFMENVVSQRDEAELLPKIKVIIDPSAASFIALLRKKPWAKVLPADNDVLDGIRETATAMQKGLIKISPSIKEWRKEASGYVWDDKNLGIERPIKENDHYMDSTRYFVKTMRLAKEKQAYRSLWGLI